jgi:hypothetical protein
MGLGGSLVDPPKSGLSRRMFRGAVARYKRSSKKRIRLLISVFTE